MYRRLGQNYLWHLLEASTMTKINAELDGFEVELVASLLGDEIVKNRQMAKLDHATGTMSQEKLDWHLAHADFIEAIARKLLPDFHIPAPDFRHTRTA